jgi:putative ABC transport system permease protein
VLRKNPGFATIVVTTLALGIGANTAIYSIIRAVLLQPLPYREPERLVAVWDRVVREKGTSKLFAQYRDLELWQGASQSFEQLAGITWATSERILTGHGSPRNVLAIPATTDLFSMLGVAPMNGRTFEREDLSRGCTVVLTHRFWRDVLGAPRNVSDLHLALDDRACAVIGVMPAGFVFFPDVTSMWVLVTPNDPLVRTPERTGGLGVFGRLKPGVTVESAQAELTRLSSQLDRGVRYGVEMEPRVYPLQAEFSFLANSNLRLSLFVLFGAVGFVLLIACVNVTNLLLGRSWDRQRELAIRAALGSGRARLALQLLTEHLTLSLLAAVVGALLATMAVHVFRVTNPVAMPAGATPEFSWPVLGFAAGLAITTTIVFGLVPALRASRMDLQNALKTGGRGTGHDRIRHRLTKGLIVAEIALSLVLLVGAGLLIESVMRLSSAPLGFEPRGVLTMSINLPSKNYSNVEQRIQFFDRLLSRLQAVPDVQQVALSTVLPLRSGRGTHVLVVEGRPLPTLETAVHDIGEQSVTADYFRLMGIPLEKGRTFEVSDSEHAVPIALINEALARKYFPHDEPIGQQIRFEGDVGPGTPWVTVVGVVSDEKRPSPYQEMSWGNSPYVYRPLSQKAPSTDINVLLRAGADQAGVGAATQRQVAAMDPGVVLGDAETAQHLISRYLAYPRFRAVLLGLFAGLALLLAVVGLYGVLSNLVAQRIQEIGVRMALGATKLDVLALVVQEGMLLAVVGVTIGIIVASWLSRFLASLLFGVEPSDPITWCAVSLVLLAAALLATSVPARRAASVDPMVALRCE